MKKNSKVAILFDLDDTLIPTTSYYPLAVQEAIGCDENYALNFQEARAHVKNKLPPKHVAARNRILYFKAYLEILGDRKRSPVHLYDSYEGELVRLIRNWGKVNQRFELLKQFSLTHDLYILTNENARTQLNKIDALLPKRCDQNIFKEIFTSEECGFEKPNIEFFNNFFESKSLKPTQCILVGDDYDNDIAPALRPGITAIQSIEFLDSAPRNASHTVISNLKDLVALL